MGKAEYGLPKPGFAAKSQLGVLDLKPRTLAIIGLIVASSFASSAQEHVDDLYALRLVGNDSVDHVEDVLKSRGIDVSVSGPGVVFARLSLEQQQAIRATLSRAEVVPVNAGRPTPGEVSVESASAICGVDANRAREYQSGIAYPVMEGSVGIVLYLDASSPWTVEEAEFTVESAVRSAQWWVDQRLEHTSSTVSDLSFQFVEIIVPERFSGASQVLAGYGVTYSDEFSFAASRDQMQAANLTSGVAVSLKVVSDFENGIAGVWAGSADGFGRITAFLSRRNPDVLEVTVAHEIGHNYGATDEYIPGTPTSLPCLTPDGYEDGNRQVGCSPDGRESCVMLGTTTEPRGLCGYTRMHIGWLEKGCYTEAPADAYEGSYFDNLSLSGFPRSTRNDGASLDFTWTGSPAASCGIPVDGFSGRWVRTIDLPTSGPYRISTEVDGVAGVFVDGVARHQNSSLGSVRSRFSDVSLSAGQHELRVDFYDTTGIARLKVNVQSCDVSVSSTPQAQTIYSGQSATLQVVATGSSSLGYQWYSGGSGDTSSPIPAATGPTLVVYPTSTSSYWVRVSGDCASWSSETTVVTVQACPSLSSRGWPSTHSISLGESATLWARTTSSLPVTYRWYLGSTGDTRQPLSGSGSTLRVSPSSTTRYWVRVSSACRVRNVAFIVYVTVPVTYRISLQTYYGPFVVAEGGGGGEVLANRWAAGPWETFDLIDLNGGDLRSGDDVQIVASSGHFFVAEGCGGDTVNANRTVAASWETFSIHDAEGYSWIGSGSQIGLQSACGWWVVAEGGGGGEVNANRTSLGPWETFTLIVH